MTNRYIREKVNSVSLLSAHKQAQNIITRMVNRRIALHGAAPPAAKYRYVVELAEGSYHSEDRGFFSPGVCGTFFPLHLCSLA